MSEKEEPNMDQSTVSSSNYNSTTTSNYNTGQMINSTQAKQFPPVVCSTSDIQGNVVFGKGCIVHPGCSIIAQGGDIVFGDFNIIEERALIVNRTLQDKNGNYVKQTMNIGNFNLFEVGSVVESSDIGNYNTFQHRTHLELNCKVNHGCIVGMGVRVPTKTVVDDYSAIYYPGKYIQNSNFNETQHKLNILSLVDTLSKILPLNNQLKKI